MKKILIILFLLTVSINCALAGANDYAEFMKSLNLSQKQTDKIEAIEKKYIRQYATLNAEIILKNMQIAQLRVQKNTAAKIKLLNSALDEINEEYDELKKQEQDEIASTLGFFQKRKYKKFCKLNCKS